MCGVLSQRASASPRLGVLSLKPPSSKTLHCCGNISTCRKLKGKENESTLMMNLSKPSWSRKGQCLGNSCVGAVGKTRNSRARAPLSHHPLTTEKLPEKKSRWILSWEGLACSCLLLRN